MEGSDDNRHRLHISTHQESAKAGRSPTPGGCIGMDKHDETTRNILGFSRIVDPESPTVEFKSLLTEGMASINAWVEHQMGDGREVLEFNSLTREYRMRPLRPEDV